MAGFCILYSEPLSSYFLSNLMRPSPHAKDYIAQSRKVSALPGEKKFNSVYYPLVSNAYFVTASNLVDNGL